jgi:DNA-binding response OmpR family regulator
MARVVVLIVDDHADTREMYAEYLTLEGFETIQATCCLEALSAVGSGTIDVMVLDRGLPDGDGRDVIAALRSRPEARAPAIIVLSGTVDDGAIAADAYLVKPVMPDALLGQITRLLRRASA